MISMNVFSSFSNLQIETPFENFTFNYINSFFFILRFFGFDLCLNSYHENKRCFLQHLFSKFLFLVSVLLINIHCLVHIYIEINTFKDKKFYNLLNDLRSSILKLTMAISVNYWWLKKNHKVLMIQGIVNNQLFRNSQSFVKKSMIRWSIVMVFLTFIHWLLSQFWLSSLSTIQYKKWLIIANCTKEIPEQLIYLVVSLDSYVYRMYIYGSRLAMMCVYSLFCFALGNCIKQLNRQLYGQIQSKDKSIIGFENFKIRFNLVYEMHLQIERCFGSINFLWFSTLFIVSCIDIFFIAWSAGSEWFKVWSFVELVSMVILWLPHLIVSICAFQVSHFLLIIIQSKSKSKSKSN